MILKNNYKGAEVMENIMDDLLMVGKKKLVGYLPLGRIEEAGISVSDLEQFAKENNLAFAHLSQNECSVWNGAVYMADLNKLQIFLDQPENDSAFFEYGKRLSAEELFEKIGNSTFQKALSPKMYDLIAYTFHDMRAEYKWKDAIKEVNDIIAGVEPEKVDICSVEKLRELANPFGCWSDIDTPITQEEVWEAVRNGESAMRNTNIFDPDVQNLPKDIARNNHILKIAYFVENPTNEPISIDVGVPELGCNVKHIVDDGNHRFAAAICLDRETIGAYVAGSTKHMQELGFIIPVEKKRQKPTF